MARPRQSLARGGTTLSGRDQVWRVTTATRVFVLAMAGGLELSDRSLSTSAAAVLALCVLAAIMSALDFDAMAGITGVPVAEAVLAVLLVAATANPGSNVVLYLAVPPLVAGLRHGFVSATYTVMAELLALAVAVRTIDGLDNTLASLRPYLTWLWVGVGVGLLAAWLHRSARGAEDDLAPYVAAHKLLDQLRAVSRRLPTALDTPSIAEELVLAASSHLGSSRVVLLTRTDSSDLLPLAATSSEAWTEAVVKDERAQEALDARQLRQYVIDADSSSTGRRVAVPVRVGSHVLGVLVAEIAHGRSQRSLQKLQSLIDGHSLRLHTAMLFDEVRSMATLEERNRLAREVHDGVAQEIASLGYLVDDLAASSLPPASEETARELRRELSRVVSELRLSIFDLRSNVQPHSGLGFALAEYASEMGKRAGLTVHLALSEKSQRLHINVESELLRIAQEAITNARKHAHASNLWVTLNTESPIIMLRIEDDGIGSAQLRDHHYGLRIMRERAERIGAQLDVSARPHGGTSVVVTVSPHTTSPSGAHRDNLSLAR